MPASRSLIALAVAALALPVAACGSSDEGLLTQKNSERLLATLDEAQNAVDRDNCGKAGDLARDGADRVTRITGLDDELRDNLLDGFNRLSDEASTGCQEEDEEKTPTPTPSPTPTPTPTETVVATPTPTETVVPTPTATEPPVETPVPTETVPPAETPSSGGTQPDDTDDGGFEG